MTMKAVKLNFEVVDERQPNLIVKLAPTDESGQFGEAVVEFVRLLEPREVQGTTKDGRTFKTTRYEAVVRPIEGTFIDAINKEEVPKKDPKTGKVIGKELIPKVWTAEELAKEMEARGNDGVVLRLSQGSYEFLRKNVNAGKIQAGDIIKLEYTIGPNGGASIRRVLKAKTE